MVIWPMRVCGDDANWLRACALMQLLPLDLRTMPRATRLPGHQGWCFATRAQDLRQRPTIWLDRRAVLAPYFRYELRFSVSASILGSIDVDDDGALREFDLTVQAAIKGGLSAAERTRWEAGDASAGRCAHRHYDELVRLGLRHEQVLDALVDEGLKLLTSVSPRSQRDDSATAVA